MALLNTKPVFAGLPNNQWLTAILAANTTKDGSSGTIYTVFSASLEAAYIDTITLMPLGTNVATVARVFANNGSPNTTAANNAMIAQATCPATTNSEVAAIQPVIITINKILEKNETLFITLGTAVAAGFTASVFGSSFAPSV